MRFTWPQMFGVAVERYPWLLLTELMLHKDLRTVLRACSAAKTPLRAHEFANMAAQLAAACLYLAEVGWQGCVVAPFTCAEPRRAS